MEVLRCEAASRQLFIDRKALQLLATLWPGHLGRSERAVQFMLIANFMRFHPRSVEKVVVLRAFSLNPSHVDSNFAILASRTSLSPAPGRQAATQL